MNQDDFDECRDSFIAERMAILEFDSGLFWPNEAELRKEAEKMWEQYRRQAKIYLSEQEGLI